MSVQSVDGVERSVHKTNDWLSDLEELLGADREEAWRILKAFLQVLRDELTRQDAVHERRLDSAVRPETSLLKR